MAVATVATMTTAVAITALVATFSSASAQPIQLLSEERLVQEAIFIGGITDNLIHQAVFPEIRFVCPGNLTRWTLVARPVGGGSRYPEVHVWRREGVSNTFTRFKRNKLNGDSPSPVSRVYEAYRDPPLQFEAGDVLGVYNPNIPALALLYQDQGGYRNYYIGGPNTARETFDLNDGLVQENRNDYPLVSVDVNPPECAVGFIKRESLLHKASLLTGNNLDLTYREGTQRIIPEVSFPADGEIVNVTLGGLRRLGGSQFPQVQLWRSMDGGTEWFRVASIGPGAAVTYNTALNVHRYTPLPPVTVQAGDILGLYQPHTLSSAIRVFMQGDGPVNYYRGAQFSALNRMSASGLTERRIPLIRFQFSTTNPPTTTLPTTSLPTTTLPTTTIPSPSTAATPPNDPPHTATTTPHHPTTPPLPVSRTSNQTRIIVASTVTVVMLLMTLIAVGVALLVRGFRRSRSVYSRRETPLHHYDTTVHVGKAGCMVTPATKPDDVYSNGDMEYNTIYPQSNPAKVVIKGEIQAVELKLNTAYSFEESKMQIHATNPATLHPYEDVDIGPSTN